MDERRRTISSEESMIGEALMRVSNTLEAQRLTKSLDYQEKLRSRANIRLIIAIICLVLAGGLLIIGGVLLFVLLKYQDPVLDTVVPFLKNFLTNMNTMFVAITETTTYLPVLMSQMTQLLDGVLNMLGGLDLSGMLGYLDTMMGVMVGMMSDLPGLISGITDSLSDGSLLSGLGIDTEALSNMVSQSVGLLTGTVDAASTIAGAVINDETVDAAANIAGAGADAVVAVSDAVSTVKDALGGLVG